MLDLNPYESLAEVAPTGVVSSSINNPLVPFAGTPHPHDATSAYCLAVLTKRRLIFLTSVLVVGFVVVGAISWNADVPLIMRVFLGGSLVVQLVLLLGMSEFSRRWRERSNFRKEIGIYQNAVGTIGPAGIEFRSTKTIQSLPWQAWLAYRMSSQVIVLFERRNVMSYRVLARRQFSNEQDWERAQTLVREHLPEGY